MALTDKSSIVVPKGFYGKANVLQGFNPQTENLVDLDVVRNTTATRVNEQGLIESVPANVPRRDFLNGGCGELLVEPQRTNLLTYSEQFDNADWTKSGSTITPNATTAPDGNLTADQITSTGTGIVAKFNKWSTTQSAGGVFAKAGTSSRFEIGNASTGGGVIFDLSNGTIESEDAGFTGSIKNYGNGWYKISAVHTAPSSGTFSIKVLGGSGETGYIWGAQLEEGSYPTSYIPTTASAVTRNQDNISLTGAADLLGDSAGGLFIEASWFDLTSTRITLSDGTTNNRVLLFSLTDKLGLNITSSGTTTVNSTTQTLNTNIFYKVAFKYAVNDVSFFLDGLQEFSDNTVSTYSDETLNSFRFVDSNGTSSPFYGRIRQLVIFDQALTDAELEAITTP